MATYKRLTLPQRYLIQTLHQQKQTQHQIAQQVGVNQATVNRELARNAPYQPHHPYQAEQAQQRAATAKARTWSLAVCATAYHPNKSVAN